MLGRAHDCSRGEGRDAAEDLKYHHVCPKCIWEKIKLAIYFFKKPFISKSSMHWFLSNSWMMVYGSASQTFQAGDALLLALLVTKPLCCWSSSADDVAMWWCHQYLCPDSGTCKDHKISVNKMRVGWMTHKSTFSLWCVLLHSHLLWIPIYGYTCIGITLLSTLVSALPSTSLGTCGGIPGHYDAKFSNPFYIVYSILLVQFSLHKHTWIHIFKICYFVRLLHIISFCPKQPIS